MEASKPDKAQDKSRSGGTVKGAPDDGLDETKESGLELVASAKEVGIPVITESGK